MKTKRLIGLRGLSRGSGHWGNFPRILNSLDSGIDLELLEIPGNGTRFSESPPLHAEKAVEAIRAKSRLAQESGPYSILGISLGGMLALKWIEMYPEEVSKIFIVNSSLSQLSPFFKRLQWQQIPAIVKALREKDFVQREKMILDITSNEHSKSTEQLLPMAAFSKQFQVTRTSFLRQLLMASMVRIKKTSQRNIQVIGAQKDRLVDISCSLKMAQYFEVEPIIHPTAGHDIPLDDPDWLAKIILQT